VRAGFATGDRCRPPSLSGDEPIADGGTDIRPSPYDLLLVPLGPERHDHRGCMRDGKQWPLWKDVTVRLRIRECTRRMPGLATPKEGMLDVTESEISLQGELSAEQRTGYGDRGACPVHAR